MAKEKERLELKPVDESADPELRLVRLHKDAVEEVEQLPTLRVGDKSAPEARLVPASREELKTRSNEPDVGSLIEMEVPKAEDLWETEKAAGGRVPWGWVAVIGSAFAAGILWSLVEVNRADGRSRTLGNEAQEIIEKERQEEMDAEELISTLDTATGNFFDSRSVDELLRYVRHPERVRPLMESYYADKAPEPMRLENVIAYDPLTIGNFASFWMVSCELEGGMRKQVLVQANSKEDAKIDWETFVCYQPMPWDDFATSRPAGYTGDFRVYVERDHFYSNEFSDADTFACFRLTALGGEVTLFGYVNRKGLLAQRISELIDRSGGASAPMILRLNVPRGIVSKRGVVVQGLVCPRWMFIEDPGKEEQ
jgi:hypothetical protein